MTHCVIKVAHITQYFAVEKDKAVTRGTVHHGNQSTNCGQTSHDLKMHWQHFELPVLNWQLASLPRILFASQYNLPLNAHWPSHWGRWRFLNTVISCDYLRRSYCLKLFTMKWINMDAFLFFGGRPSVRIKTLICVCFKGTRNLCVWHPSLSPWTAAGMGRVCWNRNRRSGSLVEERAPDMSPTYDKHMSR